MKSKYWTLIKWNTLVSKDNPFSKALPQKCIISSQQSNPGKTKLIQHYKLCWPHHMAFCPPKKERCLRKEHVSKPQLNLQYHLFPVSLEIQTRRIPAEFCNLLWGLFSKAKVITNLSWYLALNKSKSPQALVRTLALRDYLILWYWQIPTSLSFLLFKPIKKYSPCPVLKVTWFSFCFMIPLHCLVSVNLVSYKDYNKYCFLFSHLQILSCISFHKPISQITLTCISKI